jgi:DNA-binding transcriptional LysR family regulator
VQRFLISFQLASVTAVRKFQPQLRPRTVMASTLEPLIFMAEQGMGIAYLPDFAIRRQLREGILVAVLDDYSDRSGPLRVLWPSSRHLAPKLRVFVDFLATNLFPLLKDCPVGKTPGKVA